VTRGDTFVTVWVAEIEMVARVLPLRSPSPRSRTEE
jgi:hypothetical protein